MKYLFIICCTIGIAFASCSGKNAAAVEEVAATVHDSSYVVRYARGFSVNTYPDYKEVIVRNPWDTTKILQTYILVDKSRELPKNLPKGSIVRTPLTEVVAFSTIHCSTFQEIDVLNSIVGVCEPQYIDIPFVEEGVKSGSIADLGDASKPNIEKIIELSPEAIFISPILGHAYNSLDKTGVPIIETPDYMESLSLGRAEWIRFYSLFYNNEALVDSLFDITVRNYNAIKEKTALVTNRPSVFMDLMNRGTWYISGGESFLSKMIADAGAVYVWHNNGKNYAVPLPFEQILNDAGDADFWLIKYYKNTGLTYNTLEKEYKPYSYFRAFKEKGVYECNTKYINYYEDLPIHPDYILQDFAYIFHPELFPDYTPRYYSKMKDK